MSCCHLFLPDTLNLCRQPCRLLLRNHEALSALEAAVTGGPSSSSGGSAGSGGNGGAGGGSNAWKRLMNLIIQLRKVVDHPFIMPDSEPGGEGSSDLRQLLGASGEAWQGCVWRVGACGFVFGL